MDPINPIAGNPEALNQNPIPSEAPKDPHGITILAMAVFVLLSLGAVVFLYYQNQQLKGMIAGYQTIAISPTPATTADPTTNWKTYTNSQYGFEFKTPAQLVATNANDIDGSVTVSNKTYLTKQFTLQTPTSNVSVRVIIGWTNAAVDPYGVDVFTKQIINGDTMYTAYTENKINEPGCFSSTAHILTADKKNTIELGVTETCPSDTNLKPSLQELNQILSTFKFLGQSSSCNVDGDCQNGMKCMEAGPVIQNQPIRKICVSPGQALPL